MERVPVGHDAKGDVIYEEVRMTTPQSLEDIMRRFKSSHLPFTIRSAPSKCEALATQMWRELPHNSELVGGLLKLLEAKDYFVRARLAGGGQ